MDATIADLYLVSSLNRNRVIDRPIIYAIIDVFSRIVTGIYVGLEGPSWIGAMMTLDNMIEDKVEYCRKYGIEISEEQWPCKHLSEIIIADRGEFEGFSVENLINNLNIKIEDTSPYRGDLKGIVERSFRITNDEILSMFRQVGWNLLKQGQIKYLDLRVKVQKYKNHIQVVEILDVNKKKLIWIK